MVTQLAYFTIGVTDVARAAKFYGALFGWAFDDPVGPDYAHVNNTALPCGLHKTAPADLTSFYFKVDDIEAATAKVNELGGTAEAIAKAPSGLSSLCTDGQGTRFSLWQPAEGY